jgi:hypothetical protein
MAMFAMVLFCRFRILAHAVALKIVTIAFLAAGLLSISSINDHIKQLARWQIALWLVISHSSI